MKKYLLISCIFLLLSCGSPSPSNLQNPIAQAPTNLILITIDTWRYDAAGFLGHPVLKTPHLDQLASEGTVFDQTYAHAVVTQPSHASILTGQLPFEHGIRDNSGFRLNPDAPTMASLFQQQGFTTAGFVSAFPLDARYGFDRGFDVYDDFVEGYSQEGAHVPERPGKATLAAAKNWYQHNAGKKRFMWVHLYGPHFPYHPEAPFAQKYPQNPYLGEVAQVDHELSAILEIARSERNTIVVVTADHGEGLGDHGELTHGLFAYEATLRVPLLIWGPPWIPVGRQKQAVGHIDILPTLAALFHLPPTAGSGRNLLKPFSDQPLYFEALSAYFNRGWAPLRGCVAEGKKTIHLPIPELYDLSQDPQEKVNLAGQPTSMPGSICFDDSSLPADRVAHLSPEEQAKLASLGYSSAVMHGEWSTEKDPKNLIKVDYAMNNAFAAAAKYQWPEACKILSDLLKDQPDSEIIYQYLSDYQRSAGDLDGARNTLIQAVRRGLQSETTCRKLALAFLEMNHPKDALQVLAQFTASDDPETHTARGKAHAALGMLQEAQIDFERALNLDPNDPQIHADFGTLFLMQKQWEAAQNQFQSAIQRNPNNASAWNGLGIIASQQEQWDQALDAFSKAIAQDPHLYFAQANIALLREKKGMIPQAIEAWQVYLDIAPPDKRPYALHKIQSLETN